MGFVFYKFESKPSGEYSSPLKKQAMQQNVYGIGIVTANKRFQFKPGMTSTVEQLFVKEGDTVNQGDPIIALGATVFKAPFAGSITQLPAKIGENVFPQSILYSLVDLQDRYLLVSLEQRAALKVKQGQEARISFDSLRDKTFTGTVEALYSQDNSFFVRIRSDDLSQEILPGMTADVAIAILTKENALVIPVAAIESGKVKVRKGESSQTQAVTVTLGIADGAFAEVIAGDLKEGDQLLLPTKR